MEHTEALIPRSGKQGKAAATRHVDALLAHADVHLGAWRAAAWRAMGTLSVAIGIVNAFPPLLPTTVFLLIGAWAWGKGAPEWRARLLAHPRWGEPLRQWANGRRMSRRGKRMATVGFVASWLASALLIGPSPAVFAVGLGLAALAAWLWSRPEPMPEVAHG